MLASFVGCFLFGVAKQWGNCRVPEVSEVPLYIEAKNVWGKLAVSSVDKLSFCVGSFKCSEYA